jgi:hypothetical protein
LMILIMFVEEYKDTRTSTQYIILGQSAAEIHSILTQLISREDFFGFTSIYYFPSQIFLPCYICRHFISHPYRAFPRLSRFYQ